MRMTINACIITALICAITLSGCATSQELVKSTTQSANELMSSGMTNEAVTVLSEALENEHIDDKGLASIFGALIHIKLTSGQDEEARALYLEAVTEGDNSKVIANYGRIISYYRYMNDSEAMLEWTQILMNSPLPKNLSVRTAGAHANTLYGTDQLDKLIALVPTLVEKYQSDTRQVLMTLVRGCLNKKDFAGADAILNALEENAGSDMSLKSMAKSLRCHNLAAQDKITEASAHFQKTVPQMSEQDASYALSTISKASMNRPKHAAATDKLCQFILSSQKDKPKLQQGAARLWIDSARAIGNLDVIPERLNSLIEAQISPACIFSAYLLCCPSVPGQEGPPSNDRPLRHRRRSSERPSQRGQMQRL